MSSSSIEEYHWRPDQLNFLGIIFLEYMSTNASIDVVGEILKAGNVVNAQSEDGSTALMIACRKGDVHIAKILLCAQADPHIADSKGRYPLAVAAFKGNLELVKALVEAKADITFAPEKKIACYSFRNDDTIVSYHVVSTQNFGRKKGIPRSPLLIELMFAVTRDKRYKIIKLSIFIIAINQ